MTNDIASLLCEADRLGETLTNNIQNYFIGKIVKRSTREKFCKEFQIEQILPELNKIAKLLPKKRNRQILF